MGQLTNQFVSQSYQGLLNLENANTGFTENLQIITDGLGGQSPLQISKTQVNISGSLTVNGQPISIDSGSLVTTSSFNAFTSSIDARVDALEVETGSLQSQIDEKLNSSSFNSYTSSNDEKVNELISQTGSYVTETESGSFMIGGSVSGNTLTFTKGDGSDFSLTVETGSIPSGVISGSQQITDLGFATTSSVNEKLSTSSFNTYSGETLNLINEKLDSSSFNSYTSSNDGRVNSLESKTGSYATTGSNVFKDTQTISGSLNVTGEITALSASITYLQTIYQTSSIVFSSGSNILGDEASDVQTLNGTVNVPLGNLNVTGATTSSLGFFGNLEGTSSYAAQALSASYAPSNPLPSGLVSGSSQISYTGITDVPNGIVSGSVQIEELGFSTTSSLTTLSSSIAVTDLAQDNRLGSLESVTSSYITSAQTSSMSVASASFATTASYALNVPTINTGSFATTGSNTFNGDQVINGTLSVTGQTTLSGLDYPIADGLPLQFLQTDGAGTLTFAEPSVTAISENMRNGEATTILKGTPVYVSGSQGATPIVYRADASDPNKMPAIYIANANIPSNNNGSGLLLGLISGIDTTGYPAGTEVYVAPGGGWSPTRPTGSAAVQLLGIVTKEGNGGAGVILNAGEATLPNLASDNLWLGNVNGVPVQVDKDTLGFATTGSNTFIGNQVIQGSLGLNSIYPTTTKENLVFVNGKTYSGSLPTDYLNAITTSLNPIDANIVFPNRFAGILDSVTGSVEISGGNNVILNLGSAVPAAQGRKQIVGSANIVSSILPTLNTSSLTTPTINNNYIGGTTTLTFTTGSNLGNAAHQLNNNILLGTTTVNHPSASLGGNSTFFLNNISVGGIASNATSSLLNAPVQFNNNINTHPSLVLNSLSSSLTTTNNIFAGGGGMFINNRFSNTGSNNNFVVSANLITGQGINVNANGTPATNTARTLVGNLIGGQGVNVSVEAVGTDLGGLRNSFVYGFNLNISGSHAASNTTQQGAAFVGRWNGEDNGLADSARTVFAVGTGTAAASRRTSLYVTSGSLVGVSGSLDVKGDTIITGSLTASGTINGTFVGDGAGITGVTATLPAGVVSGSSQISYTGITDVPSGLVSGSSQITGFATTGSNSFVGNQTITGSIFITDGVNSGSVITNQTDVQTLPKVNNIVTLTQAEYNTLATGSALSDNTLYVVSGSVPSPFPYTGEVIVTGSVSGNVGALSITSLTASMDTNTGNFFTLSLPNAATHILPTNIKPGQTINVRVIGDLTSTVTFPSSVKQPSGSLYVPTVSGTDILTFVSFDGTDIYMANVKKLI